MSVVHWRTDDALTIQGERRQEHEESREGYYRSERAYGSFYRSLPLPDGANADGAKANFRDGVLEVVLQRPVSPGGPPITMIARSMLTSFT